jgi:uncharacterized tellurite resistance protein B-like protein
MQKEVLVDNLNYHYGLLHFAYILVNVDGVIDEREREMMRLICQEEEISEELYQEFLRTVSSKTERQIFEEGLRLLKMCTHEEKTAAVVHLFRLSEADDNIHRKELKLLFYSLDLMDVEFDDVELSVRMANSRARQK